jgi:ABC-type Fe3+-siderophore transport system permease subunit
MTPFILGATALASLVAALFFLRFWRDTRDRLFCFFAIAFGIDALHRVVLRADHRRHRGQESPTRVPRASGACPLPHPACPPMTGVRLGICTGDVVSVCVLF